MVKVINLIFYLILNIYFYPVTKFIIILIIIIVVVVVTMTNKRNLILYSEK